MKKIIVLFLFSTLGTNIHAQFVTVYTYDRYYAILDSLLVVFRINIEKDLALSGYSFSKQPSDNIHTETNGFILEVFFMPKHSSIIAFSGTTSSMINNYSKQYRGFRFVKRAYFDTFRNYTQDNNKLPYDIIDYFKFRFITYYDNSPNNHAIYGEYKFRLNEDKQFEVSEKKVEILSDRDAIVRKYQSTF